MDDMGYKEQPVQGVFGEAWMAETEKKYAGKA